MFFAIFFVHDKKIYPKRLFIGTPCFVPTYTNLFVHSNDFLDKPCFSLHSRQPCSKRLFIGTPRFVPTYTNLFVHSNDFLDKPCFSLHSRQPCSKRLFIGTPCLADLFKPARTPRRTLLGKNLINPLYRCIRIFSYQRAG